MGSQNGRPALLLEDPGGIVLEQRLDRPLELPLALLKYAHARQFRTRLTANAKELCLELSDDGDGFRVGDRHDGVGLAGMRERAEEMGGEFKIVSSRGKGTKITVILPQGAGRQPAVQPQLARPSTGMGMEAAL